VNKSLRQTSALSAQDLCLAILQAAQQFMEAPPAHNDVTALALLRYRAVPPGSRSSRRKFRNPLGSVPGGRWVGGALSYGRTGKRK
jgi:hypothetical protein